MLAFGADGPTARHVGFTPRAFCEHGRVFHCIRADLLRLFDGLTDLLGFFDIIH